MTPFPPISPSRLLRAWFLALAALLALPALAQDSMQQLRQQLSADKKQLVAANLELTPTEAAAFWPLYEQYQKELQGLNDRIATLVMAYAREYKANTLTDEGAARLMKESMAVDEAEVRARQGVAARLTPVLPGRKLARYLQIENKVRALVRYEIAAEVPLAR